MRYCPKLSIVVPIFNASECLRELLVDIGRYTVNRYELILIDDKSDEETRNFVHSVDLPKGSKNRLIKVLNRTHSWVNYNWNLGASLARGKYIAFLNSDVYLAPQWDTKLIETLQRNKCACPHEIDPTSRKPFTLYPVFKKNFPHMIKGTCFMIHNKDKEKIFPIPEKIKHWCGDNVIADRIKEIGSVGWSDLVITHQLTQSGRTIHPKVYAQRVREDVDEYESWSKRNMDWLREIAFRDNE
jgi:glycosyltransferase involved in cell wall biosynthesis